MPITPVSSNLISYPPTVVQGNGKAVRPDMSKLATAPSSVDLSGAKDAFNSVQRLLQGAEPGKASPPQEGGSKPQKLPGTDLLAFGKTLVSGVLDSAQDSVKSLLGDIQSARSRYQPPAQGAEGAPHSVARAAHAGGAAASKPIGTLINTRA